MPVAPRFSVLRRVLSVSLLVAVVVVAGHVSGTYAGVPAVAAKVKAKKCAKGRVLARLYRGRTVFGGTRGRVVCVRVSRVPRMRSVADRARALAGFDFSFPAGSRGPSAAVATELARVRRVVLETLPGAGAARAAAGFGSWHSDPRLGSGWVRRETPPVRVEIGEGPAADYIEKQEAQGAKLGDPDSSYAMRSSVTVKSEKCPQPDGFLRASVQIVIFETFRYRRNDGKLGSATRAFDAEFHIFARVTDEAKLDR